MSTVESHPLPAPYASWLTDLLDGPLPAETRSTCDTCVMCPTAAGPPLTAYQPFRQDVKCCAYMPDLPPFLVGRALREPPSDPGRASVWARVQARVAVTPLGVGRPPSYALVYDKTVNTQGRARSLRCPHFVEDGGRCGIHAHRNHLCATWFCRPVRGVRGRQLWQSAEKLLAAVERDLSMAAALHLGIAPSALAALLPALLTPAADIDADAVDGVVSEAVWAARWGSWADCIEDYFEAAAAFVDPMSWTDVLSACGPDVHIRARVVQDLAAGLDAPIPVRLRAGILHTLGHGEGTVAITTTDPLDPMVLPTALLGALVRFDGRPVHQVVAQLRNEGIELDDATLRALVDHAVLVE